jgi:hypothetical protein
MIFMLRSLPLVSSQKSAFLGSGTSRNVSILKSSPPIGVDLHAAKTLIVFSPGCFADSDR